MENPQWWEKPRQPTGCEQYHYMRGIHSRGNEEANDLSSSSLPHAAAVTMRRQQPLSLSLRHALSRSVHLTLQLFYNISNYIKNCALSHIYTHMTFRHIYISVHPIGSVPIGAGSAMSRFSASCIRFHPEGHVSQHNPIHISLLLI